MRDQSKARAQATPDCGARVTHDGNGRWQLSKMAMAARKAMGVAKLQALADRGDVAATSLKDCVDVGIATYVPKTMTSNAKVEGRFGKSASSARSHQSKLG